jgi:hypothetical protein
VPLLIRDGAHVRVVYGLLRAGADEPQWALPPASSSIADVTAPLPEHTPRG